jgi:putative transposase
MVSWMSIIAIHVDVDDVALIRASTNKGLALGNERFKQEIEQFSGLRVTERKRGPKPKSEEFLL